MEIQSLIDKHEQFKAKSLMLNEDDLFNWIMLWEAMLDKITELKSVYQEEKQQLDVEKWLKMIELKSMLDDKWKKIYTESTAEATIAQLFFDRNKELATMKLQTELLLNKTTVLSDYINIVKLNFKK